MLTSAISKNSGYFIAYAKLPAISLIEKGHNDSMYKSILIFSYSGYSMVRAPIINVNASKIYFIVIYLYIFILLLI